MPPFGFRRHHDIARIYIDETRTAIDTTVTSIFPPDQEIMPGDIAAIEDGRFVRTGNVTARGLSPQLAPTAETAPVAYATANSVSLAPSVRVPNPATGGALVTSKLLVGRDKSVVACFNNGEECRVADSDEFSRALLALWYSKEINPNRVVVWSSRQAIGGTVLVSAQGGNSIDLSADAAVLGPAGITLSGLTLGVSFGAERKATWKISSSTVRFTTAIRAFYLNPDQRREVDSFRFSADKNSVRSASQQSDPPLAFTTDAYATILEETAAIE